jgi:MscS family membrane protein
MNWHEWLTQTSVAGNELWRMGVFFLIILASFIAGRITQTMLLSASRRADSMQRPMVMISLTSLASSIGFLFFAIGLELALDFLWLPTEIQGLASTVSDIIFVLAIAWLAYWQVDVVEAWMSRSSHASNKMGAMMIPLVRKSLKVTIVILAILQVATVLSDKPVTSLLAGLGVGGLAVALAAQDTLKNFFGSLVLFADKPFQMGDRVVVDGHDGPVEEVGFRSTRIRTLQGNLVSIPNGELANKTILNIGQRPYIQKQMNIGITYDTPPEKVHRALEIVRELLAHHEGMKPEFPPKVYFNEFAESSLNLMVIFWYHPPNYWDFMAFCERLNFEILNRFNAEGIEMAYPTQTIRIKR